MMLCSDLYDSDSSERQKLNAHLVGATGKPDALARGSRSCSIYYSKLCLFEIAWLWPSLSKVGGPGFSFGFEGGRIILPLLRRRSLKWRRHQPSD
jgi:hypothetical protein